MQMHPGKPQHRSGQVVYKMLRPGVRHLQPGSPLHHGPLPGRLHARHDLLANQLHHLCLAHACDGKEVGKEQTSVCPREQQ